MNTVSVVVAERGSDWLDWARHLRGRTSSTIVLAQNESEGAHDFAERVQHRLGRLHASGTRVEQAAFVGSADSPAALTQLRPGLLRKLSAVLSATAERSKLYLDAAAEAPAVRRMLAAMAWTLSELAAGSGLSISVDTAPAAPALLPAR